MNLKLSQTAKFVSVAISTLFFGSLNARPLLIAPNTFHCTGDNVSINYIKGDKMGKTSMTVYVGRMMPIRMENVTETKTLAGNVISAIDENLMDATSAFSIILPEVLVSPTVTSVNVAGVYAHSYSGGYLDASRIPEAGPLENIAYTKVNCEASILFY